MKKIMFTDLLSFVRSFAFCPLPPILCRLSGVLSFIRPLFPLSSPLSSVWWFLLQNRAVLWNPGQKGTIIINHFSFMWQLLLEHLLMTMLQCQILENASNVWLHEIHFYYFFYNTNSGAKCFQKEFLRERCIILTQ